MRKLATKRFPEGFVCRLAREEDHDAVCAINKNIYEGMDYLPGLYQSYLRNPLRVMGVAVLKDQIVSLLDWEGWTCMGWGKEHWTDYSKNLHL